MSDSDKAEVASKVGTTVSGAYSDGIIGRQTALKELRQSSRVTGIFTNITQEMVKSADDDIQEPPSGMDAMGGLPPPPGGVKQGAPDGEAGQDGQEGKMDQGPDGGGKLQLPPPRRRPTNRSDSEGPGA